MADQPQQPPAWRAIQPPKLPRFTGEADGCEADEFIQEAERILRNYRMEDGTAVEWIIQALEGSARREVLTRAAGEADTAAQVLSLQIIRAIKLPPNQKRERTTGKKRLKCHGPGHTQYTRSHNNYHSFLYVCHAIILLKTIVLVHVIVTSSVCMYTKSLLTLSLGGGEVCN